MRCQSRNLPILERIEYHITSKEQCWKTDFSCIRGGYPKISVEGKIKLVHRVMYELHFGEIPPGMYVCHTCDNRKCVNPDHLFLGTPQDNMDDMKNKGRSRKGSQHGRAKLNEEQVLEIKRLLAEKDLTHEKIAKRFGVSRQTITHIKNGKYWNYRSINTNYQCHQQLSCPVTNNITINNYETTKAFNFV
jgi:DNA-binding XRE family transcriptional regulator